jgi:hypothetical protein
MLALGFSAILDPYLIAAVDLGLENDDGDMWKMYNYYKMVNDNSGASGMLMPGILTLILNVVSCFLVYNYLITLHFNGRMLDLYHRITGDDSNFYFPQDFEISLKVFRHILDTAKKFRGTQGSRRQVSVTSYTTKDHLDVDYETTVYHVAIYTVEAEKPGSLEPPARSLFRHFLRKADGSIVELFDSEEDFETSQYRIREEQMLTTGTSMEQLEKIRMSELNNQFQELAAKAELQQQQAKQRQAAEEERRQAQVKLAEEDSADEDSDDSDSEDDIVTRGRNAIDRAIEFESKEELGHAPRLSMIGLTASQHKFYDKEAEDEDISDDEDVPVTARLLAGIRSDAKHSEGGVEMTTLSSSPRAKPRALRWADQEDDDDSRESMGQPLLSSP